ncbi:MAG: hypothetical protein DMG49_20755 [Acidobacteria bacterium]|nr:MAG: hypothetical protein DMG49_20755 [Acidobacteriota bacterium]
MRVLVTGATGFVGRHLVQFLKSRGETVFGTYLSKKTVGTDPEARLFRCDVRERVALRKIVGALRPKRIYHLAAVSSSQESLRHSQDVFEANFLGTYNLLESVRQIVPDARVLVVGSGQCYGPVKPSHLPVTEDQAFAPPNPYALSKAAADMLAGQYYFRFGLHIIRARPFNHTGPGQMPGFVCSDFARQIADVRDGVQAYQLLLEKGKNGEAYNVASGQATWVWQIVRVLASFSSWRIRLSVQGQRFRPGDVRTLYGSSLKLRRATGWKPAYNLRTTLRDLYVWWKMTECVRS